MCTHGPALNVTLVTVLALVVACCSMVPAQAADTLGLCPLYLTDSDVREGIGAYEDALCLVTPRAVGCFANSCRYCKNNETEQSKFYRSCDLIERVKEQMQEATPIDCAALVSQGDQDEGISAYLDESCPDANDNVRCQPDQCRFCQLRSTALSKRFRTCPSIAGGDECATAISESGYPVDAVSYITEPKCSQINNQLVGCVAQTTCRLCRRRKSEENQLLTRCEVLQDLQKQETALAASRMLLLTVPEEHRDLLKLPGDEDVTAQPIASTTAAAAIPEANVTNSMSIIGDSSYLHDDGGSDTAAQEGAQAESTTASLALIVSGAIIAVAVVVLAIVAVRNTNRNQEMIHTPREDDDEDAVATSKRFNKPIVTHF